MSTQNKTEQKKGFFSSLKSVVSQYKAFAYAQGAVLGNAGVKALTFLGVPEKAAKRVVGTLSVFAGGFALAAGIYVGMALPVITIVTSGLTTNVVAGAALLIGAGYTAKQLSFGIMDSARSNILGDNTGIHAPAGVSNEMKKSLFNAGATAAIVFNGASSPEAATPAKATAPANNATNAPKA